MEEARREVFKGILRLTGIAFDEWSLVVRCMLIRFTTTTKTIGDRHGYKK